MNEASTESEAKYQTNAPSEMPPITSPVARSPSNRSAHVRVAAFHNPPLVTYDERGGLWNPFRPEDRDAIQRQVRTQLESAGEQFGIVEHANESARLLLQTIPGVLTGRGASSQA